MSYVLSIRIPGRAKHAACNFAMTSLILPIPAGLVPSEKTLKDMLAVKTLPFVGNVSEAAFADNKDDSAERESVLTAVDTDPTTATAAKVGVVTAIPSKPGNEFNTITAIQPPPVVAYADRPFLRIIVPPTAECPRLGTTEADDESDDDMEDLRPRGKHVNQLSKAREREQPQSRTRGRGGGSTPSQGPGNGRTPKNGHQRDKRQKKGKGIRCIIS